MGDTSRVCVCGHEPSHHYGLQRECLACADATVPCLAFELPTAVPAHDPVSAPSHYTWHPSGIEQIQISEHMTFNLGAAIKYIWRAGRKSDAVEDMRKAIWHLEREIKRVSK